MCGRLEVIACGERRRLSRARGGRESVLGNFPESYFNLMLSLIVSICSSGETFGNAVGTLGFRAPSDFSFFFVCFLTCVCVVVVRALCVNAVLCVFPFGLKDGQRWSEEGSI